jgi:hypothetical protein
LVVLVLPPALGDETLNIDVADMVRFPLNTANDLIVCVPLVSVRDLETEEVLA